MSAFETVSEVFQDVAGVDPRAAEIIQEALPRVQAMLQAEDRGWAELFSGTSGGDLPGPDLDHVKEASELAREMAFGSPLIARGLDLRTSYVWSKGVVIEGAPTTSKGDEVKRRGPKGKKETFFGDTTVQRHLLSSEAHKDMEASAFTDGHFFLVGDDKTKKVHPIPLYEIDMVYLNPDYSGEVWAYRRTWTSVEAGRDTTKSVWYYVDTYTGDRKNPEGSNPMPKSQVDKEKTLFVKSFNTMVGWPLGVGDALPALKWARFYAEMVNDGRIVSKANAKFTYKAKNKTAQGAQNAAATASNARGVGNIASLGDGNDLIAIPQSNRSYDFNGLRPIAAQVATALNVSVVHILSDPGAAGSSYGSASNLDLPTKRAMVSRQSEWVEFLQRVIKWGTGEDLAVSFPSLDDPDPYREMQLVTMSWNSGVIHPEEMRDRTLAIGGFTPLETDAPEGVMLPNNEKSLNRSDVDTDSSGGSSSGVSPTASSPDQGARNGTGGVSDSTAKDLRNEALHEEISALREQVSALARFLELRASDTV